MEEYKPSFDMEETNHPLFTELILIVLFGVTEMAESGEDEVECKTYMTYLI